VSAITAELSVLEDLVDDAGLARLCEQIFVSMTRVDQRRWGEAYVRGLVAVPGRKTIQKIAERNTGATAVQSLQQFVNQSPWDWAPVLAMLARTLQARLPVRAWLVDEVAFPKAGQNSVGVASQFAPAVGRRVNCQLATALSFVGDGFACPVQWRLMLPRCWDEDAERRKKAHLPTTARHRPVWSEFLHVVDEARAGVGVGAPPPLILDRRHDPVVEPLLGGFDERGLSYAVRIAPGTPIATGSAGGTTPARHVVRAAGRRVLMAAAGPGGAHFVAISPGSGAPAGRQLVLRRQRGRDRSVGLWLTNLDPARLPQIAQLTALSDQARADASDLERGSGLHHFEGRSYRGWHHHVTLVSVAHAHRVLCRAGSPFR
jgi:hypothetical protein